MISPLGIYIHIPFCRSKCNYCSFYSLTNEEKILNYCDKIISDITRRGEHFARPVSSVYIGGGTPSILPTEKLVGILDAVKNSFCVLPNAEITVEANPADDTKDLLKEIRAAGCNRLSIGLQSGDDEELKTLGRRHTVSDAQKTFLAARNAGFNNISLDLMIGLPESDCTTLKKSLDFALSLDPEHISSYILKIEQGTPFYKRADTLGLPDDDNIADQYLFMSDHLAKAGYEHYEISNFAKAGFESKHNINYWKCGEYLGFGAAAHSFFGGERFYYESDIGAYMRNSAAICDGKGGTAEEYIMLGLRLSEGIHDSEYQKRFGTPLPRGILDKAALFEKNGLCKIQGDRISLTDKGMLVSNSIITEFTEELFNEDL